MTHAFTRTKRIDILLATLVGEHHVRSPLLWELADELAAENGLEDAVRVALALASDAERLLDDVFAKRVSALTALVQDRLAQKSA